MLQNGDVSRRTPEALPRSEGKETKFTPPRSHVVALRFERGNCVFGLADPLAKPGSRRPLSSLTYGLKPAPFIEASFPAACRTRDHSAAFSARLEPCLSKQRLIQSLSPASPTHRGVKHGSRVFLSFVEFAFLFLIRFPNPMIWLPLKLRPANENFN
jgi:hypothetical protein